MPSIARALHPRARRPRDERLPRDGEYAYLRLDRCRHSLVTLECRLCRARATDEVAELRKTFGEDHNVETLPPRRVACPDKYARRDAACSLRLVGGGLPGDVRPIGKVV